MTAADLIRRAADAGISMNLGQDGRLQLRAAQPPSAELLAELAALKVEIIASLRASNDPQPASAWLHLLVLDNGRVIQRSTVRSTVDVECDAHQQHGDALLRVVPVPGVERCLNEGEVAQALAGVGIPPAAARLAPSSVLLSRVARLLGILPGELVKRGYLERHDLTELAGVDAEVLAWHIKGSPAWVNRPRASPQLTEVMVERGGDEAIRVVHTAASASTAWKEAHDAFTSHQMACSACYAPLKRYCPIGADLFERYIETPMR